MLQVDVRALKETLRDGIQSLHLPAASPATLPASSEVSSLYLETGVMLLIISGQEEVCVIRCSDECKRLLTGVNSSACCNACCILVF